LLKKKSIKELHQGSPLGFLLVAVRKLQVTLTYLAVSIKNNGNTQLTALSRLSSVLLEETQGYFQLLRVFFSK